MQIADHHLDLVRKYNRSYHNRIESDWSLEKDLNYTRQNIRSFHREFNNPFFDHKGGIKELQSYKNNCLNKRETLTNSIEH